MADLKLIASAPAGPVDGIDAAPLEIFDLARDAHERQPMSLAPDASTARWVAELHTRAARFVDGRGPAANVGPLPADIEDRLRHLGYVQ